ncbi:hypothetical protein CEXT_214821 [Caerostris extrusa]|uniref:Uncharacterized protein n=1 Tax=Caerostris extrusa TaxID=172846 RepID=A0AAV4YCI1_CAEEX|nr:hypothetical protein CEXT_214821 [Caerostris extrusa]
MFSKVWAFDAILNPKLNFSLRPEDRSFFFCRTVINTAKEKGLGSKGTFLLTHRARESEIENDGFSCPTFPDTSPFASQCTDF